LRLLAPGDISIERDLDKAIKIGTGCVTFNGGANKLQLYSAEGADNEHLVWEVKIVFVC